MSEQLLEQKYVKFWYFLYFVSSKNYKTPPEVLLQIGYKSNAESYTAVYLKFPNTELELWLTNCKV